MTRPLRITYPGAFYHITSRGNERKQIFKSLADREKFLSYLESATKRYDAIIHVYCLMDNHYHLDYSGNRTPPAWLEMDFILGYFGPKPNISKRNYREFIEARLGKKDKSPLSEVVGSTILGSADFVKEIKERCIDRRIGRISGKPTNTYENKTG